MVLTKKDKREVVKELKKKLGQYKVVAVASVQNLPAKYFNKTRKALQGHAEVVMTREALIRRALDEARPELKPLQEKLEGSCVLLLSNESPFALSKLLRKNKSKAFAKAGQLAPFDIIIPEGETNLPPGPVLTELKAVGIDARLKGPKVSVGKPSTVAKKGQPISQAVASVLIKLAVEPMEVGMKMRAAYEDGTLYGEEALSISEEEWIGKLQQAHQQALNLSVAAGILNKYSVELLIQKAARTANALNKMIEAKQGKPAEAKTEAKAEAAGSAEGAAPADASQATG